METKNINNMETELKKEEQITNGKVDFWDLFKTILKTENINNGEIDLTPRNLDEFSLEIVKKHQ